MKTNLNVHFIRLDYLFTKCNSSLY